MWCSEIWFPSGFIIKLFCLGPATWQHRAPWPHIHRSTPAFANSSDWYSISMHWKRNNTMLVVRDGQDRVVNQLGAIHHCIPELLNLSSVAPNLGIKSSRKVLKDAGKCHMRKPKLLFNWFPTQQVCALEWKVSNIWFCQCLPHQVVQVPITMFRMGSRCSYTSNLYNIMRSFNTTPFKVQLGSQNQLLYLLRWHLPQAPFLQHSFNQMTPSRCSPSRCSPSRCRPSRGLGTLSFPSASFQPLPWTSPSRHPDWQTQTLSPKST